MTVPDTLRLLRNVLFRTFAVGVVFALLALIAMLTAWPVWTGLAMQWFHAGEVQLGVVALQFFTAVRFYFVFVLLAPALALQWTITSERASASRSSR